FALVFFFFQAEDGIRDFHVTGVQTCALPICTLWVTIETLAPTMRFRSVDLPALDSPIKATKPTRMVMGLPTWRPRRHRGFPSGRSEERRVGKECRCRWSRYS